MLSEFSYGKNGREQGKKAYKVDMQVRIEPDYKLGYRNGQPQHFPLAQLYIIVGGV